MNLINESCLIVKEIYEVNPNLFLTKLTGFIFKGTRGISFENVNILFMYFISAQNKKIFVTIAYYHQIFRLFCSWYPLR